MQTMNKIADLTKGFIESIMDGVECKNPILQILGAGQILRGTAGEVLLQLLLSDGEFLINSNYLVNDNEMLVTNAIIRVDKYEISATGNSVDGDKLLIILGLTVLIPGTELDVPIGAPVPYVNNNHSSTSKCESSEKLPSSTMKSSQTSEASSASNNSSMSQCESECSLTPVEKSSDISDLSPYQEQWVIKARVAYKSPVRPYKSRQGILFSIELIDKTGEIRAIAFQKDALRYYNMVEVDKVYFIWGCLIEERYKKYPLKHDYEIHFTNETKILLCEDTTDIPYDYYNFIPISEIAKYDAPVVSDESDESDVRVDVIGVCLDIGEPITVRGITMRHMQLEDSSNTSVTVTLWHEKAKNFSCDKHSIISVKGAFIIEYEGVNKLSCCDATRLRINPDELQKWFDSEGKANSFDLDI